MAMDGIQPVMDINRGNGYSDGFGGNWAWIIVILALFWGGGNWGNNGGDCAAAAFANGAMTRNEVTNGFNAQEVNNGIRGIQNGLADGFYAQNTTMLQGFNNTQRDIMQTGFQLNTGLLENRFATQQGFCETNRNIDSVKFEGAQNTCQIINAIHADGEATRALITTNVMQELRDRLADRDRDLLFSNIYNLSQAQTQTFRGIVYNSQNGCGNYCGSC